MCVQERIRACVIINVIREIKQIIIVAVDHCRSGASADRRRSVKKKLFTSDWRIKYYTTKEVYLFLKVETDDLQKINVYNSL